MKRIAGPLLILALVIPAAALVDPLSVHDRAARDKFAAAYVGKLQTPAVSFQYGGKPSAGLFKSWPAVTDTQTAGTKTIRTTVYTDPATKLQVTVVTTMYSDFPAVEWVARFKNAGGKDTPIIEGLQACDVVLADRPAGAATLYRALGSSATRSDFAPVQDALAINAEVVFGPSGGRSSDSTALPFFNIASDGAGVMAAIGWSGSWTAAVKRTGPQAIRLRAGQSATRFVLHPGEEVRIPSVALVFWKAPDRLAGHNLFRRFILAHHSPFPKTPLAMLPFSSSVGSGGPLPCNEHVCATESYVLAAIDRLRQFKLEPDACWIDAGWYENASISWWAGVGNWTINKANFPRGFRPITDATRAWDGKRFVLWFEPERVYEGTRIDREHPEWVTKLPGNPNRLLNLGDPQALRWLIGEIARFLKAEGVSIYRQDFNFDPALYWKAMDAPDRVGVAEMKHIAGLYAFWDGLLAAQPGLLIDNCASGGRRIDLETVGRSVPLWRTDYSYFEPNGYQCHTYGLHLYLPWSGTGNNDPRKYNFRSSMNGAVVTGWELNNSFPIPLAQDDIAEFRALRPYFLADYYPLTEYSTGDEAWAAFQWDRPEERDGIVLAFRRPSAPAASIVVRLRGLDPEGDYEASFEDYGIAVVKTGRELGQGLSVKIPDAPGSLLIRYKRVR
ncbi:MAG: alpha-galactosidase [Candidatus Aminicenantes bacterium]|nr:alpha-galactosidase [Candidatus Aminicenantes bacterium]